MTYLGEGPFGPIYHWVEGDREYGGPMSFAMALQALFVFPDATMHCRDTGEYVSRPCDGDSISVLGHVLPFRKSSLQGFVDADRADDDEGFYLKAA